MAVATTAGRIILRDDGIRQDWIVGDGLNLFNIDGIELQSPFFEYPSYGGLWQMTLHHSKAGNCSFVTIYVGNRDCVDKAGYEFTVGLVDRNGEELFLGSDVTAENGVCVIRRGPEYDHKFKYFNFGGRLIVYCKSSAKDKR